VTLTDPQIILIELTRRSGLLPKEWPGKCFQLASCLVEHKIVIGVAVYGHWRGPVVKNSLFGRGAPFVQHGWVKRGNMYQGIVDPTRWVFEGKEPYIYIGPNDHYDEGGNKFRQGGMVGAPSYDPNDAPQQLKRLPLRAWKRIQELLTLDGAGARNPVRMLSCTQLFWIARMRALRPMR